VFRAAIGNFALRNEGELTVNRKVVCRIFALLILGFSIGSYVHHDELKWHRRGREAFLADQMQRFDRNMANPHPTAIPILSATILAAIAIGAYELAAKGVSLILDRPGEATHVDSVTGRG
jgi:hypothetical protein